jgi:hypothetical protein
MFIQNLPKDPAGEKQSREVFFLFKISAAEESLFFPKVFSRVKGKIPFVVSKVP